MAFQISTEDTGRQTNQWENKRRQKSSVTVKSNNFRHNLLEYLTFVGFQKELNVDLCKYDN